MDVIDVADATVSITAIEGDNKHVRMVVAVNGNDVIAFHGTPQMLRTFGMSAFQAPIPESVFDVPLVDDDPNTTPRYLMGL